MPTPLINGVSYGWGSISFVVGGLPFIGITKIAYKKTQTKENIYGAGYNPVSRGYGKKEFEGSITIKREELNRLIDAAPNNNIEDIPPFNIPVVYSDGTRVQPRKDTLVSVEFDGFNLTTNQGDTSMDVEIGLIIGDIVSV